MHSEDLRDYLDILEEYQELKRIDAEVDWNLEMGAITRRVYDLGAPAALFENVKGYPKGFRALGAPLGGSKHPGHGQFARTALAMNMVPTSTAKEIMATYLARKEKLIPPIRVKNGPCKENIDIGDAVDVLKFPIPLIHGGDGGRYIGTWHTVITKDPESSWVNWGMYRLMVHDRNTLGCLFPMQQHIGQMYQKYEAMNKPMPVAVAIGGQPVIPLVSCVMLPPYVNEAVPFTGSAITDPVQPGWMWTAREHVFRSTNYGLNPAFDPAVVRDKCNVWFGDFDVNQNGTYEPLLDVCDDWKPLGDPGPNGRLTARSSDPASAARRRLEEEAARFGVSPDAVALAGVLAQPWADVVLSGAAAVDQLHSNLAALAVPWDQQAGETVRGLAERPEDYWHTRAQLSWN